MMGRDMPTSASASTSTSAAAGPVGAGGRSASSSSSNTTNNNGSSKRSNRSTAAASGGGGGKSKSFLGSFKIFVGGLHYDTNDASLRLCVRRANPNTLHLLQAPPTAPERAVAMRTCVRE